MSRRVYVLRGSHDGVFAVYSNVKAAYQHASDYIRGDSGVEKHSYTKACASLKQYNYYDISSNEAEVEIIAHEVLNKRG